MEEVAKESNADHLISKYAERSCRKLCEDVQKTFPREIRDMIYRNLIPWSTRHVDTYWPQISSWDPKPISYFNSSCESDWNKKWADHKKMDQHLWKVEFMGLSTRQEIAEEYYRTVQFKFWDSYELINPFLITDQWKLGLFPAEVVANVAIMILLKGYDFPSLEDTERGDDTTSSFHGNPEADPFMQRKREAVARASRAEIITKLSHCFAFKPGATIFILFTITDYEPTTTTCLDQQRIMFHILFPLIIPTLQRFEKLGYKVRVCIEHEELHRSDHQSIGHICGSDYIFEGCPANYESIKGSFDAVCIMALCF